MSSLRNASLVLKTSDMTPTPAIVNGYYSNATTLNVTNVVSGSIAATTEIYGNGTVSAQATWGTSTGGVGTIVTAGQTSSLYTGNFSNTGNNVLLQTPTTTQTGCSISAAGVLTLGGANASVAVGQYLSGTGIVAGTYILSGAGTTWQVNNNTAVAAATYAFYTPINIGIGQTVSGSGIPAGTVITVGPTYSSNNGISYTINNTLGAFASENVNFYTVLTVNCLSLSDATASSSVGSSNAARSILSWNNINLRTVLGDMYDKFDIFNLCLNTVCSAAPQLVPSTDANNLMLSVRLSGIPLLNQSYNTLTGHNENATVMGMVQFSGTAPTSIYYNSPSICSFGKNSDIASITIEYRRVVDATNPNTLGAYQTPALTAPLPHVLFLFDIIGVEKGPSQQLSLGK